MKALLLFISATLSASAIDRSPLYLDPTFNVSRQITGTDTAIVPLLQVGSGNFTDVDTFHLFGSMRISHVATENDDHAIEIDVFDNGFSDVKAIDIDYITGAISAGEDEEAILINIDEVSSTGGRVTALEVLSTKEGGAKEEALFVGIGIDPIEHLSGVFEDADSVLSNSTDISGSVADGGVGGVSIFSANNDTITIGNSVKFEELEFILDTGASGAGIKPTFEFSNGGGFTEFGPSDGTNAFRNTGVVAFEDSDIPAWAIDGNSEFTIKITRTRNVLNTTPIVDLIQIASATEFKWDKDGDVKIRHLSATTSVSAANMFVDVDLEVSGGVSVTGSLEVTGTGTFQGNVGIGTTSLTGKLNVFGAGQIFLHRDMGIDNNTPRDVLRIQRSYSAGIGLGGIGTRITFEAETTVEGNIGLGGRVGAVLTDATDGSVDSALIFETTLANITAEKMRIDNNGNVGIGITSPVAKLHVSGDVTFTGDLEVDGGTLHVDASSNKVGIGVLVPSEELHVKSFSPTILIEATSTSSGDGALSFTTPTANRGSKIFHDTAFNDLFITTGRDSVDGDIVFQTRTFGTPLEVVRFKGSGNVGIGTASPDSKFHILHATNNRLATFESEDADVNIQFKDSGTTAAGKVSIGATNDDLILKSGGSITMILDDNGNVGIGITSPIKELHVAGNGNPGDLILERTDTSVNSGDNVGKIGFFGGEDGSEEETGAILVEAESDWTATSSPTNMTFSVTASGSTSNVESMRIASDGNVGIGTISPQGPLHVTADTTGTVIFLEENSGGVNWQMLVDPAGNLEFRDAGKIGSLEDVIEFERGVNAINILQVGTDFDFFIEVVSDDGAQAPNIILEKARGGSGGRTDTQSGDELGRITFSGQDGTSSPGAAIVGEADAEFGTGADTTDSPGRLVFMTTVDGTDTLVERMRIDSDGNVGIGMSSSLVHSLNVSGTAGLSTGVSWINTSDERLKNIHGPYEKGLAEVLQLEPIWFNYKKDNPIGIPSDFTRTGFSAQAVQKVYPEAVSEREDGYLQLNVDPLYMSLFNAVKELNEKIERLEKKCVH